MGRIGREIGGLDLETLLYIHGDAELDVYTDAISPVVKRRNLAIIRLSSMFMRKPPEIPRIPTSNI
jgi:hypothetical protein